MSEVKEGLSKEKNPQENQAEVVVDPVMEKSHIIHYCYLLYSQLCSENIRWSRDLIPKSLKVSCKQGNWMGAISVSIHENAFCHIQRHLPTEHLDSPMT